MSQFIGRDRILNYVWCNREPFTPTTGVDCGVPLHYVDKAIDNAKRYPDTAVNVWLDNDLLDAKSIALTKAHIEKSGLSNIHLHDLCEIPAFRAEREGLFDPHRDVVAIRGLKPEQITHQHHNVWGRVDLARLLVVDHCLETTRAKDVLYSDFDTDDARLNDPQAQKMLEKYGVVLGCVDHPAKDGSPAWTEVENSYFGFRKSNMDKGLLKDIIDGARDMVAKGHDGYGPYYQKLAEWFAPRGVQFPVAAKGIEARNMGEITFDVSKPMLTQIARPKAYKSVLKP